MASRFSRNKESYNDKVTLDQKKPLFKIKYKSTSESKKTIDAKNPNNLKDTQQELLEITDAENKKEQPLHMSWGFEKSFLEAMEHDSYEKLNKSHTCNWFSMPCPKCAKENKQSTHKLDILEKVNNDKQKISDKSNQSLTLNKNSGDFLCHYCGYHGNIKKHPRKYKSTWLDLYNIYLMDSCWNYNQEDEFKKENQDFTSNKNYDFYRELIKENKAVIAPYWDNKNNVWKNYYHLFCLNSTSKKINDIFVLDHINNKWQRPKFTTSTPYGLNNVDTDSNNMIIVNHMEDYISMIQSSLCNVICLPPDIDPYIISNNNHSPWKVMEIMENHIKNIGDIVLSLRSDSKSRDLEEELGRRIDKEKCYRTRWFISDDDNEEKLSAEYIYDTYDSETLNIIVSSSQPFPVIGVYELQDIDDKLEALYETGLVPGAVTGWPSLDYYYTVKPGQWTVLTGIPGHGKSSFLDNLLVNLASINSWRFALFSPETQPVERHFASLMEKKLKKPFSKGPTPRITIKEKNKTKRWLNDHFKIILPDEENGVWTVDAVLKLAKKLVYRHGIRGLVIDPWNEIDHSDMSGKKETDHISESLTKIRRFARLYDVHVWIVAHPTKLYKKEDGKYPVATPYDISGGAHWRNKADNALCVYRNVGEIDQDICDIHIQKIRFQEIGNVGIASLRCDNISKTYIDDINQDKRLQAIAKGKEIASSNLRISKPRIYEENNDINNKSETNIIEADDEWF